VESGGPAIVVDGPVFPLCNW